MTEHHLTKSMVKLLHSFEEHTIKQSFDDSKS